jgi:CRP/FNR family transcriptional regulator, cyclic AMP receptor protein
MPSIAEMMAESPTFAGLAPSHLELIAGCGANTRFATGEPVFRTGQPAASFYLIRHGSVALELAMPDHEPVVVETLHDGEVVGWSWLFEPHRWMFDAHAVDDTSAIAFDGACLRGKCDADHELGYQLMCRFAGAIVNRLQATRLQLLDVYGSHPVN